MKTIIRISAFLVILSIFGCQSGVDRGTEDLTTINQDPEKTARGKVLYAKCAPCHGHNAEGSRAFGSPALANQEDWYLYKQLKDLISGNRLVHHSDSVSLELMMAAKSLTEEEIDILLSYINLLPPVKTDQTIFGDAENGKTLFNKHCVECHGIDAKGLLYKQSPNLLGIQDYYIATQLKLFRDGKRGYAPNDSLGMVMQEKATILSSDEDIDDLVTYIHLLQTQRPKYY